MNLSYWEYKTWLAHIDFTVVGSGITGLNCVLQLRERFPNAKILVLEKGVLPQGASTKNAGFACFGSISEILDDLKDHTEDEVVNLVNKRWQGIQFLRKTLGDTAMDFQQLGGFEIFSKNDKELFESSMAQIDYINGLLLSVFGQKAFELHSNTFGFGNCLDQCLVNSLEGQLDPGKMMVALLKKVRAANIGILNGVEVQHLEDKSNSVVVTTPEFEFSSNYVFIATNGFAAQLTGEKIKPGRAQVLLTKPLENLKVLGTFHLDRGYSYFRNLDNRILLGGGRNLDFSGEETTHFGNTELIQLHLEKVLTEIILPKQPIEIDRRWSGIMGVGNSKKPIVKQLSDHMFCGIRLGGMGVAIGSLVGKEMANLV
ncbi:FAD-dependent oxidoreductase [Cytophaga sp. FL35]|uniref:NAD(P)/FAD-dependent oxidoreductase n=1 Tax=Cytophaga sp. FL35 TaxID=1904456 RepID=UPI0016538120|nr:FAD-dependent oxidoreductase [Cytophaga sp. FL35]MBC6999097.1 FAD-binding oxidoreductase [Cytophaga sp. FL35]